MSPSDIDNITVPRPGDARVSGQGVAAYRVEMCSVEVINDGAKLRISIGEASADLTLDPASRRHLVALLSRPEEYGYVTRFMRVAASVLGRPDR